MIKKIIKKFVPDFVISLYHWVFAFVSVIWYGYPSRKMIVIGVTGTNGKSTTVNWIGRLIEHAGHKVGWLSTANLKIADREWVNNYKMTMLGRFRLQKLLREMVDAGCKYAIVETSSQGLAQHRHLGINYDVVVMTNLTPEHIEAHGGFENYKKAKGILFSHLTKRSRKIIDGKTVPKVIISNIDDSHSEYYLNFKADKKYGFGLSDADRENIRVSQDVSPYVAEDVKFDMNGSNFRLFNQNFHLNPIGRFNVYNAVAAAVVCKTLGFDEKMIAHGVSMLSTVPGRLEAINEGQSFAVFVDYSYEPAALRGAFDAVRLLAPNNIIHVVGSAGGGRDKWRRKTMGELSAINANITVVTNEDPYDEDPMEIIRDVADGARTHGRIDEVNLFVIPDRQEAIKYAIGLASVGDLVLITGKGCEPVMAVAGGKLIPWDDREAARRALHNIGYAI